MSRRKQRKQMTRSAVVTPRPGRKLFVDYPYPVINELSKACEQHKSNSHLHTLTSLKWCRNCFHRMFGVLHDIRGHISSNAIIEESLKHAHVDENSTKRVVNNLQEHTQPIQIQTRRKLAASSSMSPPMNGDERDDHR